MEGARRDEQDMVRLHRAIFGRDGRALDERQQVALNAFAAHRTAAHVTHRDLVDLVKEDDPVRLGIGQRDAAHLVLVKPLVGLFLDQLFPRRRHQQLAPLGLPAAQLAEHFAQVDHAHLAATGHFERHLRRDLKLKLDLGLVEVPVAEALAEALARRGA